MRDELDTTLAQKYFAVQLARSIVNLREATLAQQEFEVKKARAYEKAGTISKLERMTVEVNRDAARRELLSAQTDCTVAERELSRAISEYPLFVVTGDIGSAADWVDKALAFSPAASDNRRQAPSGRSGRHRRQGRLAPAGLCVCHRQPHQALPLDYGA